MQGATGVEPERSRYSNFPAASPGVGRSDGRDPIGDATWGGVIVASTASLRRCCGDWGGTPKRLAPQPRPATTPHSPDRLAILRPPRPSAPELESPAGAALKGKGSKAAPGCASFRGPRADPAGPCAPLPYSRMMSEVEPRAAGIHRSPRERRDSVSEVSRTAVVTGAASECSVLPEAWCGRAQGA
jgi:hypothetical protein